MAKLSAHGKELSRVEKMLPGNDRVAWKRHIISIRSDGYLMIKRQIKFLNDGRLHDAGWHRLAKIRVDYTADQVTATYVDKGWTQTKGG